MAFGGHGPLNAAEYRRKARRFLPRGLFEYIDRGTEDERALTHLRDGLDRLRLMPSVMTGAPLPDLTTTLFGKDYPTPLVIAPTALAGLVVHDGEVALARAAARLGIPFCLSTQSVTAIEAVRAGAPEAEIWFQLYLFRDRTLARALVDRVAAAGASTLVVTADTPGSPNREYNLHNGFGMPIRLSPVLALDGITHPRWLAGVMGRYLLGGGMPSYGHYPEAFRSAVTRPSVSEAVQLDTQLTWPDLAEIRRWWPGKLILKGVLRPEDARRAIETGADAVVVSSHGGRNLDSAPDPAAVLPEIRAALGPEAQILADSGIRRGSDALKYIGLGAQAVMIGRLPLWGLASGGEAGAAALLTMLCDEMRTHLRMLGLSRPTDCAAALQREA